MEIFIPILVENPCDKDNGGCGEICNNVDGEAECSCPKGSKLGDDGKECVTTKCIG